MQSPLIVISTRAGALRSAVLFALAAASAGVQAQEVIAEGEPGARIGVEEVVVTARRREERLQDVPVAVSAVSSDALESRGIRNTEDLMGSIPNIQISSFVGAATPNITIRGIGVGSEFNASASSPNGVYVDEDYQSFRPGHGMQFFDLERVEVVKGPQGTLYGRNTTGGAINVISKLPSLGDSDDYVKAGFGEYSTWLLEGAKEATLVDDVFGVRLAASVAQGDGYIKNKNPPGVGLTNEDFGETDQQSVRLIARYKPTDSLDSVLKLYWAKSDPIGAPPIMKSILSTGADASGYSRAGLDDDEAQANTQGNMLNETKGVMLRVSYDLTDTATLTSVTGFSKSEYDVEIDCDGGLNNICGHNLTADQDQFNEDLRVNFSLGNWEAVAGLYYGVEGLETDNRLNYFGFIEDFFPGMPFNPPIGSADAIGGGLFDPSQPITGIHAWQQFQQDITAKAVYGEGTWSIGDAWKLTLGARYTEDETEYTDALTRLLDETGAVRASVIPFSYPYDPAVGRLNQKAKTDEVTGRVILDYAFSSDAHTYLSYSKGYRSGAFNGFAYQSADQIYFVDPEVVDAYELGVKSRLADGRVQLNGSVFYYDYQDQQVQEVIGAIGFLRSLNGEVTGAELEAITQVTDDLTLSASVGLLETKYDQGQSVSDKDVGGNSWPFAPELTFNINANWVVAKTDRGQVRFIPEVSYSDEYFYDIFNVDYLKQDAYWLYNARLTYEDDANFSVSLWGKNLGDEYYEPWGADTASFGANYYMRAMPLTYGIEATFRF